MNESNDRWLFDKPPAAAGLVQPYGGPPLTQGRSGGGDCRNSSRSGGFENSRRKVLFVNSADTFKEHKLSANGSLYPNLGLLTLMSALHQQTHDIPDVCLGYYDGAVHGNDKLYEIIRNHGNGISVIALSVLTSNYEESLRIAQAAKDSNPAVKIIVGNDHFSAVYNDAMRNRPCIDFGFYGNDVVGGFADFVSDSLRDRVNELRTYPGLVYRDHGRPLRNLENPGEFSRRPAIDYALMDSCLPTSDAYVVKQHQTYRWMLENNLRGTVVEVARGCIKFNGEKDGESVSRNTCTFCAITPGGKAVSGMPADRAWQTLANAYEHGYNYLYWVADDLVITHWPLLKAMMESPPTWYSSIRKDSRPRAMGYSMSNAFAEGFSGRVEAVMENLGFNHWFIGLDGFSSISLAAMNKGFKKSVDRQLGLNLKACKVVHEHGGLITAGGVLTHVGITPEIMRENFDRIESIVTEYPNSFAALDFGVLCPIPGSRTFEYLKRPELAQRDADALGLRVRLPALTAMARKYESRDAFNMDELIDDFIEGCCPDITRSLVLEYEERIRDLAAKHRIVLGGGV